MILSLVDLDLSGGKTLTCESPAASLLGLEKEEKHYPPSDRDLFSSYRVLLQLMVVSDHELVPCRVLEATHLSHLLICLKTISPTDMS